MLRTWPDLAFTISMLLKYCSNPTSKHAIAAKRTLQYLQKTINAEITFRGQENLVIAKAIARTSPTTTGITGFTDSD